MRRSQVRNGVIGVLTMAAAAIGAQGPADKPPVDATAADRGRGVWASACITCHGAQARGTERGPSLVRSVIGPAVNWALSSRKDITLKAAGQAPA
jgi:mono/diheme cytochrome c family protein